MDNKLPDSTLFPPVFSSPEELWGKEVADFLFNNLQYHRMGVSADPTNGFNMGQNVWKAARSTPGNIEIGVLHKKGGGNRGGWEDASFNHFLMAADLAYDNPYINLTVHAPVDINWMGFKADKEGISLSDNIRENELRWLNKEILGEEDGKALEDWKLGPIFNVMEYKKEKGLLDEDFRIPVVFHATPPLGGASLYSPQEGFSKNKKESNIYYVDHKNKLVYGGETKELAKILGIEDNIKDNSFYDKIKKELEEKTYIAKKNEIVNTIEKYNLTKEREEAIRNLYKVLNKIENLDENNNEEKEKLINELFKVYEENKELLHPLGIDNRTLTKELLRIEENNDGKKVEFYVNKEKVPEIKEKLKESEDFIIKETYRSIKDNLKRNVMDWYEASNKKDKIKEINEKTKNNGLEYLIKESKELLKKDNPFKLKEINEAALEKASDSIAEFAKNFYKNEKLRKNAFIAIENFFPEDFFSTGEEMAELIKKSRQKFIDKLYKEGVDKKIAEEYAEKLIGMTLDMGHMNLWRSRDPSVDEDWLVKQAAIATVGDKNLVEEVINKYKDKVKDKNELFKKIGEEARKKGIKPLVRHIHFTDNPGTDDTHQEIGTGNVPNREVFEFLKEVWKDNPGTITIEWGGPAGPGNSQPANYQNWLSSVVPNYSNLRNNYFSEMNEKYSIFPLTNYQPPSGIYNKLIEPTFTSWLK